MRIGPDSFFAMVASLAFLGIVRALTIDNQLTPMKNDCYERLAVGQRLNAKNVYKTFDFNTLTDCQMACTKEKTACQAFSFGIGTKGNGTCELSIDPIKETADLKPVGTTAATDYDLYTKKVGCSVVIDKNPHTKPQPNDPKPNLNLALNYDDSKPSDSRPPQSPYEKPPFSSDYPSHHYLPPNNGDEIHHVRALVSVASGPQSYLHPIHDILVGENPYEYGKQYGIKYYKPSGSCCEKPAKSCCSSKGDNPPFRPSVLSYPYDDDRDRYRYRPRPDEDWPDTLYDPRRGDHRAQSGYGDGGPSKRPIGPVIRPDVDGYDDRPYGSRPFGPDKPNGDRPFIGPLFRPEYDDFRPNRPNYDRYGDSFTGGKPPRGPSRPDSQGPFRPDSPDYDLRPNVDNYIRPLPPRYGSVIPHPDEYDRPQNDGYYPPEDDRYGTRPAQRPSYDRPDSPDPLRPAEYDKRPQNNGYYPSESDRFDTRPPKRPGYGPGPLRPNEYDKRPQNSGYYPPESDRFDTRPSKRPSYGPDPLHPNDYDKRPQDNGYYPPEDDRFDTRPPKRPDYDRPGGQEPRPPNRPDYDRPNGQEGDYPSYHYDKPQRPLPDAQKYDDKKPVTPNPSDDKGHDKPGKPDRPLDPDDPNGGYSYDKPPGGNQLTYGDGDKGKGSKVTHSVGPHGQQITSIITEIKETCFRRVLAGKRVARRCVKRALTCETVEACQRECADEKYFICEGFNYRIDPTGRGKGDCELLDVPLSRLDISRDLYPDRDYDYYERDRNAASAKCKQWPSNAYSPYPISPGLSSPGGGYGGNRRDGYSYRRGHYGSESDRDRYFIDRRYDGPSRPDYKGDRRPSDYDTTLRRPGDKWLEDDWRNRRRPRPDGDRRLDDYRPSSTRRGDHSYHHSHSQHDYENRFYYEYRDRYDSRGDHRYSGIHYLPAHYYKPYHDRIGYSSYEPYLPPKRISDIPYDDGYYSKEKDRYPWGINKNNWGSYGGAYGNFGYAHSYYGYGNRNNRNRYDFDRRNYYLPAKGDIPKDWGLYGGTYGNGGYYPYHKGYGNQHSYDYYGFNKYDDRHNYNFNRGDYVRPIKPPSYSPSSPGGGTYLPLPQPPSSSYIPRPSSGGIHLPLPAKPSIYDGHFSHGGGSISSDHFDNSILPAEPRRPFTYDFIKDECSLRSAAGFRLHKGIVKKFYAVPNIYECEILCFKERDFPCQSYAYRYTITSAAPTYNCYLSNKNYKELDHYTDVEPDRDFDIYTMNNRNRCEAPVIPRKDYSECFWRVRSGQRLDQKVVRDSLTTKSVVDCQIECLQSTRFTCRAFSFRYGSPVIGGVIDNCQLTDCPYYELDPRIHFVPEPGFEVYERGSFGHGCEPDHFGIRGQTTPKKNSGVKVDQLCYIGFGSPARLLPQATKKSLHVATELECKVECSKLREGTLFQCMSFSYRTGGPKSSPNCQLSDILQRDLLPNVDYLHDPDSWLFAWDNYNPECLALANEPVHGGYPGKENGIYDKHDWDTRHSLDTWRVYSVSGWPCRRGSLCKENREAGFWYCELEGGDKNTWDYCCRPDHQCGASNGYPYQWCYVGPVRTQWRKCNDRYYPYVHNIIHTQDPSNHYLPPSITNPWPSPSYRPGARPDRPQALPLEPPPRPSLDDYEKLFDNEFLDPPKPGGFGQARHWPVSYLHSEMPPNTTDSEPRLMRMEKEENPKYAAIRNLINVIKNNDLQNVQYHISNDSNKADDVLFVRIPLPTNFTKESTSPKLNKLSTNTSVSLEPVYVDDINVQTKRSQKSLPLTIRVSGDRKVTSYGPSDAFGSTQKSLPLTIRVSGDRKVTSYGPSDAFGSTTRPSPVYRRGFVTRTNITHG